MIWFRLWVAATGWPRSSSIELMGAFAAMMNEFFWSSPPNARKSEPADTALAMPARESWPTSTSPAMVAATSGSESSRRNSTSRPKSSRRKSIVRNAPRQRRVREPRTTHHHRLALDTGPDIGDRLGLIHHRIVRRSGLGGRLFGGGLGRLGRLRCGSALGGSGGFLVLTAGRNEQG